MDEDQLEVEVPVDEAVEVEIVDDTPDEEKQPPKKVESTPDPDSVDEMSERVQKRIKKLTFEKHETARQLAAREREHSALVNFTQGVHLSAKQLADRATRAEAAWKAEAAARREAETGQVCYCPRVERCRDRSRDQRRDGEDQRRASRGRSLPAADVQHP
jgi:outer membrane biosynthesis protein TonB